MKKNIYLLSLFILGAIVFAFTCKPNSRVISLPMQVDAKDLQNHVNRICQITPYRNYQNLSSVNAAADYIFKQFLASGLRITKQTYPLNDGEIHTNIIGEINPNAETTIVIGAHYDVCGDSQGADDNASGVAGLIELSKLFKIHEKQIPYNIQLVAYSTEEPPFFATKYMGSYIHAKSLFGQKKNVKLMIALEMIGYFTDQPKSQKYPTVLMKPFYPSVGNFIAIVSKNEYSEIVNEIKSCFLNKTKIPCESLSAPLLVKGVDFSDHRNYWSFGYPAVMITDTAFFRNPNYHTLGDTPDTLDYEKMAEVVKGTFLYILNIDKKQNTKPTQ